MFKLKVKPEVLRIKKIWLSWEKGGPYRLSGVVLLARGDSDQKDIIDKILQLLSGAETIEEPYPVPPDGAKYFLTFLDEKEEQRVELESSQIEHIAEEEFQVLSSDSASELRSLLDNTIRKGNIEKLDLVTLAKK